MIFSIGIDYDIPAISYHRISARVMFSARALKKDPKAEEVLFEEDCPHPSSRQVVRWKEKV